ncbi:hypothetical protein [Caulobacter sp. LjRoot300]|uniref:hypothetical protein n=1 Tax=Caulobacter sp. LjRoot300 TaxID=3342321 RepID=UPI003ED09C04
MEKQVNISLKKSFEKFEALHPSQSVLINSTPKAGTHLLRNVVAHFVGENCREQFVMYDDIATTFPLAEGQVVVGHVPWCVDGILATRGLPQILLIRDPVDVLVSLSRAAFAPNETRNDYVFARENLTLHQYMALLVTGYDIDGVSVGSFSRFLHEFMIGWYGQDVFLIDFSEVISLDRSMLRDLLGFIGVNLPRDWRKRLAAGMKPSLSATYIPPLPQREKAEARAFAEDLLTFHMPGAITWYSNAREAVARRRACSGQPGAIGV